MAIPAIAAGAAVVGAGYGIHQGERSAQGQRQGLRRQQQAQRDAAVSAGRERAQAEEAVAAARRRKPDVASILADEQARPSSLLLSGLGGVNPFALRTGRPSLLGE